MECQIEFDECLAFFFCFDKVPLTGRYQCYHVIFDSLDDHTIKFYWSS